MKKIFYSVLFISTFIFSSCVGDLDQFPHKETTSADVYAEAANYKAVLGKLYVSFVTAGQEKGGGNADLSSNNGQDYMRCYFNLQECGTDELASTWLEGDKVGDLTYLTWDANDTWVSDMYYRFTFKRCCQATLLQIEIATHIILTVITTEISIATAFFLSGSNKRNIEFA